MSEPDHKPTPDPTVLTTEQLLREVENSEKTLSATVHGLRELNDERFRAIEKEFSFIERHRVEQKKDTAIAVEAALNAAKEAVKEQTAASDKSITKSETATAEQLKQLLITITTAIGTQTDSLGDLKERVSKIESSKEGGREAFGGIYTFVSLLLNVLLVIGFFLTNV